tara:strand:+ start:478 stop:879 length:402 start_codon:yes stop_codon:yes gene_type:complete
VTAGLFHTDDLTQTIDSAQTLTWNNVYGITGAPNGHTSEVLMFKSLRCLVFVSLLAPLAVFAAGVDINTADAAALEQIKGVGPAKAAAIVEYRDRNGPFKSVEDLTKVPGIGDKSLKSMRDQVRVGDAGKGGK